MIEAESLVSASAGIALATRRPDAVDISVRADADAPLVHGGDLPFDDRSVTTIWLGDAAGYLPVRDLVQLLAECRRVLTPGGQLVLAERGAKATYLLLARWAALVGLTGVPASAVAIGWTKHDDETEREPLVSILMPSYNPRYFLQALDSAIAQTYRNVEIVICDDSDGDAIGTLVKSRAGTPNIRYAKNPERLRTRKNYAHCLSLASGEYVKFLNDDDLLEPDCVRTLLGAFLRVPGLTLATSHRWRIDSHSAVMDDMPATAPVVDADRVIDGISLANALIMYGLNFIGEPTTAMFRKRDVAPRRSPDELPFQFDGEEVHGAIDFALWSRLLVQGNAAFFHDRLSRFRVHDEQGQANDAVVARAVTGIRALQHQWIALGLFRRFPPYLLQCRPLPKDGAPAGNWRPEPIPWMPPTDVLPHDAVVAWRSTRKHAFDPA
jgi:glycosyltransferase involved in cell wall biosynthesis